MSKKKRPNRRSPPARLRIVAGKWRGCFLPIVDEPGLRPTSERIRETLFNWLTAHLERANCLDLFAGTGALGFEALSRGAAKVCFIEEVPKVAQAIREAATVLQASNVNLEVVDAIAWLQTAKPQPFDIVFLDPPFAENNYIKELEAIKNLNVCAKNHLIIIHREEKTNDDLKNIMKIISIKNYGRSKIIFGTLLG